MATVFVRDLCVETIIGICDWEQNTAQPLHFDIEMQTDILPAAVSDDIQYALDYAAVAELTTKFVVNHQGKLLETLINDLLRHLLKQFSMLESLTITVRKPQAIASASCAGLSATAYR
jgi:dihydroneopterin aldolase